MHASIGLITSSIFLLSTLCRCQQPQTDINDCAEIQIRNANLHPALNGYYSRTEETYTNLPVFEAKSGNKVRWLWWNQYDGFSRWSLGTDKFSSSIEGFMDNQQDEAFLLGPGRSWHVVNEQEWVIDSDFYVICSRKVSEAAGGSKPPMPGQGRSGGARPPRDKKSSNVVPKKVVRVLGARNQKLNNLYFEHEEQYDDRVVYKTDGVENAIFIFHFSYDAMKRWYIGSTLGSDYDVLAFIDDVNNDFAKDGVTQIWSEYMAASGQWEDNINMKAQLTVNKYAENSDQKAPPQQRDERDFRKQQRSNRGPPSDSKPRGKAKDRKQRQTPEQKSKKSSDKPPAQRTPEEEREDRRKQMFRRVNKLDLEVESSGKFESGINVRDEPDVIISGSDDPELNTVYFVQPVHYNGKKVYKSGSGSYLYFVRYAEGDAARWQIGQPNGGVKNDQPIAFVNADVDAAYDIATWQAWLVLDKRSMEWVRQSKVNTYRGDCTVTVEGAWNAQYNGEYGILPVTHESRPVFERNNEQNERIDLFFEDGEAQYSKWLLSKAGSKYLDGADVAAFIPSSALTVDGVSDFESWQELRPKDGRFAENGDFKVTGTCSKVKEHDWKRRRRQRAEERKRRKAMDAAKGEHCPQDMTVSCDRDRNSAVVHWQAYNREAAAAGEDDFDVVYSDDSVAPGSTFKMGRTAVTYSLRDKDGNEVAKCDFVITVKDEQPPAIDCPGDLYLVTKYNKDVAEAVWVEPEVIDNSLHEVTLEQIGGPKQGQTLKVGQYMVSYRATDMFQNAAVCNFGLYIVDRQAPKIRGCPQSVDIAVYKDQNYQAFPEWDTPTAWDNVDGDNVNIRLIEGVAPGTKLNARGKDEVTTQITYEARDSSDNAARCSFQLRLYRDDSEQDKAHQEYHKKIERTVDVEESEETMKKKEGQQDEEWSENARRLKEERRAETAKKKARAAKRKKGHKSKTHQQHTASEVHDFEESLRLEDELRDETNDEANLAPKKKDKKKNKKMTRAERRKKRREDREKRRKERADKRAKKRANGKGGETALSIVFWATVNFFWACLRPWVWPWWLLIPLFLVCFAICGYGAWSVYSEMSRSSHRRVPRYNSWSHKAASMIRGKSKTEKQRV